jgi:PAS domain S-box-containing protein
MSADDRYKRAAAAGGVGIWDWNLVTNEIYVDPFLKRLLGYEDREIRNHIEDWGRLVHPDDGAAVFASAQAHIAGETPLYEIEHRMVHRDGSIRWFLARGSVTRDAAGVAVGMAGTDTDITERKRGEEALRREEAVRAAQHQVLGMIATGSPLTDVLECLVKVVEQQSDGMLCSVVMLDEHASRVRHCAAPSLPADYVRAIDGLTIGPKHGSCGTSMFLGAPVIVTDILSDPLWEDYREVARQAGFRACWSVPIGSPQRKPIGSFAMYYAEPRSPSAAELRLIESGADIARIAIEHERANQALRDSEARNRAMLRAIPDWMFLTTTDGVFLDYHARETSRLYVPPHTFLGKRVTEVLPPAVGTLLARAFARVSASDEPEQVEYVMGAEEDERFYEACIVRCDGDKILSIVRDVTDRKRNEIDTDAQRRELAHLSRVATLGELTGALAHELSQPLTAVRSNAQAAWHLLRREPLDREELRAALDDIIRNNQRAGAVIDRLRALLRKESTAFQPVDVNDVVRDVIDLAHSEIVSRRIRLTSRLMPAMPVVQGDRIQLQQVLLNLVLNACDAMSEADSSQRQLVLATGLTDGYVELAVSDGGPGIPENQLERVFEPFVTFRQQGLGLGLAISRSIVSDHGGSISAENNPEGGATFRCLLPIARVTANA